MRITSLCLLFLVSGCAHGSAARNPQALSVATQLFCPAREAYIRQGVFETQFSVRSWLAEYRDGLSEIVSEDCAARAIAFIEETDFDEHQLWISAGYAASQPGPYFEDDGTTVTLVHGRVCGGAYPNSQVTLLRLPRGRRIQHRTTGGECTGNEP